jgi:hypothetical protein
MRRENPNFGYGRTKILDTFMGMRRENSNFGYRWTEILDSFMEMRKKNPNFGYSRTKILDTSYEEVSMLHCCLRNKVAMKAFLGDTQYFYIVDSDI